MCLHYFKKSHALKCIIKLRTGKGNITSVSYTHLDVYKRQELCRFYCARFYENRCSRFGLPMEHNHTLSTVTLPFPLSSRTKNRQTNLKLDIAYI